MGILDAFFGNKKKKIEASLQKDPTVDKVLDLSNIYLSEGDVGSALRLLRAWSKKFNDQKLRDSLQSVEDMERKQEIQQLQDRLHESPNPLTYSRLATLKLKSGQIDEALNICKESLEKFPQFNTGAHQCLGDIYLLRERYNQAAEEYELVISEDSNNFHVIKNLCEIYIYNGNQSKAVNYLEGLIKKNPADQTLKDMLVRARAGENLVEVKKEEFVAERVVETPKIVEAPKVIEVPPAPSREPVTNKFVSTDYKLSVLAPDGSVSEIALVKEEFVIGRHQEADLSIDDGKHFISRKHASIRKTDRGLHVVDLGSGNGTYVNGVKIASATDLRNNDIIKIGLYTFTCICPQSASFVDSDMTLMEDGDATIVGQEFSYFQTNSTPQPPTEIASNLDDEVKRIANLTGVLQVLIINRSGYPINSAINVAGAFDEQIISALMGQAFSAAKADSERLDNGEVSSCDIITETQNLYVYGKDGNVVAVVGDKTAKKGQVDVEVQKLLTGLK